MRKTIISFLVIYVMMLFLSISVFALPEENTEPQTLYTEPITEYTEPATEYTEPTQPETEYTEPTTEITEPTTAEPTTAEPTTAEPTTQAVTDAPTQATTNNGWGGILDQPDEPLATEKPTPPANQGAVSTTVYVINGVFLWIVIVLGVLITLGILGVTFKRKTKR